MNKKNDKSSSFYSTGFGVGSTTFRSGPCTDGSATLGELLAFSAPQSPTNHQALSCLARVRVKRDGTRNPLERRRPQRRPDSRLRLSSVTLSWEASPSRPMEGPPRPRFLGNPFRREFY